MPEYYTQDFNDLRLPGQPDPQEVDKCIPRFMFTETVRKNEATGEELLDRIEMVEIITPGDRLSRPVQKVRDDHRKRWPRQYAAFRSGINPTVDGTPIATWNDAGWQIQTDLLACGFSTIEQLAGAHDGQIGALANGTLWRKKAQVWLAANRQSKAKDSELDALRKQVEALTALVKEKAHVLHQSKAGDAADGHKPAGRANAQRPAGRGPGRPRKAAAVASVPADEPKPSAAAG